MARLELCDNDGGGRRVGRRLAYEAGPCGYGMYRHLRNRGHGCVVAASSLIPRNPGERIKTERQGTTALAHLHRANELTSVWVPDPGARGHAGYGQSAGGYSWGAPRGSAAADEVA